jgi:antitoxin component YwqK of YwqJK toxin-antitoxin module
MKIIITEEQKKKLFIPRKLSDDDSRYAEWNNKQPIVDGRRINQYDSEGRKQGLWYAYHDNGKLYSKGKYKNGLMNGYWEYYENNGDLWVTGDYKNNKEDGVWDDYENNILKNKFLYDKGNLVTKIRITEEQKKKLFIPRKIEGEGSRWSEWNKEQPIINGVRINQYDDDGRKQGYWEEEYGGDSTEWYDGEVNAKGNYINDKKDGYWEYYWDTGELFKQGTYKDGKKDGIWEEYFKDGEFWYEGEWDNGKYIRDIRI